MAETSDHDRIVRLDERMANVVESVTRIEGYMKARPCPSALCQEHDRCIERLETIIKVVAAIAVFEAPILLAISAFVWGG